MQKSIHSQTYAAFLKHLYETREKAGITQEELAERLGVTQSFVSKCERGERRIDIIELREFCMAMNITLEKFIRQFEKKLN
ncbi:MAG: helix-turn-helix domain-containing protein [Gammaproteobacteria bacterium]|nr:helix-turn-helix domain-containing protein [Gammaproteobacteria bacterium]MCW9029992.1 helix-turn-helix domain-containing protein [Gammaproteobacteria bacterium]